MLGHGLDTYMTGRWHLAARVRLDGRRGAVAGSAGGGLIDGGSRLQEGLGLGCLGLIALVALVAFLGRAKPTTLTVTGFHWMRTIAVEQLRPVEEQADLVSVDHPRVVENYRAAYAVNQRQRDGQATTEDLRDALVRYRSLFEQWSSVYERSLLLVQDGLLRPLWQAAGT